MRRPKSGIPLGNERPRRLQQVGEEDIDPEKMSHVQKIKIIYGMERSRWESNKLGVYQVYTFPKVYDGREAVYVEDERGPVLEKARPSEWVALANKMKAAGVHQPKTFMATVFDHHLLTKPSAPEPKQVCTPTTVALWKEARMKMAARVRMALQLQRDLASAEFNYQKYGSNAHDAWAYVLLDEHLELSPLFRYCIARGLANERFDKIARRYHAPAVAQFERYRIFYKAYWGKLLPPGFSVQSLRLFPYISVVR